jgi:hypothetical protein
VQNERLTRLLRKGFETMSLLKVYADIEFERANNLSWSEKLFSKDKSSFYTRGELVHQAAIIVQAISENEIRNNNLEGK